MGVTKLYSLIKEKSPSAITKLDVRNLQGKKIAIDASMLIYQWIAIGNKLNICDSDGKPINHIIGAFYKTTKMLLAGITPIFIFDGGYPDVKQHTIENRKTLRDEGKQIRVDSHCYQDVIDLLRLMNVQTVIAPEEAEAQASVMCKRGDVDMVMSNDSDVLVFGAQYLLRTFDSICEVICLDKVLEGFALSHSKFVDLCILLGTDYTKGKIYGMGPKRAYEGIISHGSIEEIIKHIQNPKELDKFNYIAARQEFNQPNTININVENWKGVSAIDVTNIGIFLRDKKISTENFQSHLRRLQQFNLIEQAKFDDLAMPTILPMYQCK